MDFSIVTPSYKQLDWLRLCIASVADQAGATGESGERRDLEPEARNLRSDTGRERAEVGDKKGLSVEHIVQDAGSPGLEEFARKVAAWLADQYGGEEKPLGSETEILHFAASNGYTLRIIREQDEGMYDAVNRGVRRAHGEICAYLNCDEQYLVGALRRVAKAFRRLPQVEVLFGDVVISDTDGSYLCSRKVSKPLLHHTWVCTLSIFTAATFIRKEPVFDQKRLFYSDQWKAVGDAVWVMDLIRNKVPMRVLREFTSVSTETGQNMILDARSRREQEQLHLSAPSWIRALGPVWKLQHRLRRLVDGVYFGSPFSYLLYTSEEKNRRRIFEVQHPTSFLPGRFGSALVPPSSGQG